MNIQEAINELREDIVEKEAQIELLNNTEQLIANKLTEEQYHKLCCTPLRNSDILGDALCKVFSFLKYVRRNPNAFVFETSDGLQVEISSTAINEVVFVVPQVYTKSSIERYEHTKQAVLKELTSKLENCESFLNEKNIIKRLHIAFPNNSLLMAAIRYMFSKPAKIFKQRLEEAVKELAGAKEYYDREANKRNEAINLQNSYINTYAPQFLQWTSRVIVRYNNYFLEPHIIITQSDDGRLICDEK